MRNRVTVTWSPGLYRSSRLEISVKSCTDSPSKAVIMSPSWAWVPAKALSSSMEAIRKPRGVPLSMASISDTS